METIRCSTCNKKIVLTDLLLKIHEEGNKYYCDDDCIPELYRHPYAYRMYEIREVEDGRRTRT